MTRFLIAILLITVALKLVVDDAIICKYHTVKLAVHDEEDKNEKNDFDNSQKNNDKKDNEDKFCGYYIFRHATLDADTTLSFTVQYNLTNPGFDNRPYTPPDVA